MTDLPGVCRSCREAVWWNGWWWTNVRGFPHTCPIGKMDADEYSVTIGHTATRPVSRLYSERRGACVREYRPNA